MVLNYVNAKHWNFNKNLIKEKNTYLIINYIYNIYLYILLYNKI